MSVFLLVGLLSLSLIIVIVFSVAVVRRALRFSRGRRKLSQQQCVESPPEVLIRVQPWQVATEDPFG